MQIHSIHIINNTQKLDFVNNVEVANGITNQAEKRITMNSLNYHPIAQVNKSLISFAGNNLNNSSKTEDDKALDDFIKGEAQNHDINKPKAVKEKSNKYSPIKIYLDEIGKYPLLSPEEEYNLAREIKENGNLEARKQFINSNLRLVVFIAQKYMGKGVPLMDLIQEGNIGLLSAVDKFDYSKGFRFSTYATHWVQQAIDRSIANKSRIVRLPVPIVETLTKIRKATEELTKILDREPRNDEIAEKIGMPLYKLNYLLRVTQNTFSLDKLMSSVKNNGEKGRNIKPIMYTIPDNNASLPHEVIMKKETILELAEMLNSLTPREKDIIILKYGLNDGEKKTLEKIAGIYNISHARVVQIQKSAMKKLKQMYSELEK